MGEAFREFSLEVYTLAKYAGSIWCEV